MLSWSTTFGAHSIKMMLLDLFARGVDEVDPLANSERRDLLDATEIEHERIGLDRPRDLVTLERLVDRADELEAGDAAVRELLDR